MDSEICIQICPNCGNKVTMLYTDHKRLGLFNGCENCIEGLKTLQDINEERKQKYLKSKKDITK